MDNVRVTITDFARWKGLDRAELEKACLQDADRFNGWPISDWLVRDEEGRPDHLLAPREAVERHLEDEGRERAASPDRTDHRKTGNGPVDRESVEESGVPEKEQAERRQAGARSKIGGRQILEFSLVAAGAFGLAAGIYSLTDRPEPREKATQDLGQRGFARTRG